MTAKRIGGESVFSPCRTLIYYITDGEGMSTGFAEDENEKIMKINRLKKRERKI